MSLKTKIIAGLTALGILAMGSSAIAACLTGSGGGTGICSGVPSDVGKVLQVSGVTPFLTYTFVTASSSGGGSTSTTTINSINGPTFFLDFSNGISITSSTNRFLFTNTAPNFNSTTTNVAGTGITISNGGTGSNTITNNGVLSLLAGSGINLSSATGTITITNLFPNFNGTTTLIAGTGITVSNGGINNTTVTNNGVTSLIAGSGISLDTATGTVTITATGGSGSISGSGTSTQVAFFNGSGTSTLSSSPGLTFTSSTNLLYASSALIGLRPGAFNGGADLYLGSTTINGVNFHLVGSTFEIVYPSTLLIDSPGGAKSLFVNSTGLAINRSTPSSTLDVNGTAIIRGTATTTNLSITALATTTAPCLSVDATGFVVTQTCSSNFNTTTTIIAGTGITVSNGGIGNTTVTNNGVISIIAGSGISVNNATGTVTITALGGSGSLGGQGTSTQIAFFTGNGTSTLTSSANLFYDATNTRLGIGTSSPQAKLHVGSDPSDQSSSTPILQLGAKPLVGPNSNGTYLAITSTTTLNSLTYYIDVQSNGFNVFTVDGNGTVLANGSFLTGSTALSGGSLYLGGFSGSSNSVISNAGNGVGAGLLQIGYPGERLGIISGAVGIGTTTPRGLLDISSTSFNSILVSSTTGNVGIGTTTPSVLLEVGTSSPTSIFKVTTGGSIITPRLLNGVLIADGNGLLSTTTPNYNSTTTVMGLSGNILVATTTAVNPFTITTSSQTITFSVPSSTAFVFDNASGTLKLTSVNSAASITTGGVLNVTQTGLGAGIVAFTNVGATATGRLGVFNCNNSAYPQDCVFMTSNASSASTLQVTGSSTNKGVLKITHVSSTGGSDANASGLSIDLQGAGTASQGIFLDSTTGSTTGNLLEIRNGGVTKFRVGPNGDVIATSSLTIGALGTGFVRATAGLLSSTSTVVTNLIAGTGITLSNATGSITISSTAGLKVASYYVAASGGDFTTIQGAMTACGAAGGGNIYLMDNTYAQGGTGLTWRGSNCAIYGRNGSTTITFTGATTLFKTNSAASTYAHNELHNLTITGDGNTSGVAIDLSDMSHNTYDNIVIDNVGTAFAVHDTQDTTFYNTVSNFDATTIQRFGVDGSSTQPWNANSFHDGFIGCGAVAGCIGIRIGNAENNNFTNIQVEPDISGGVLGGTIGVQIFDTTNGTNPGTFGNLFNNLYLEGNNIAINVSSTVSSGQGVDQNMFIGGLADTNATINAPLSTHTMFLGFNNNFSQYTRLSSTTFDSTVNFGLLNASSLLSLDSNKNASSTTIGSGLLFANGVLDIAPKIASSSISFPFYDATTTAPYKLLKWRTSVPITISEVSCDEFASATTTVQIYKNSTLGTTTLTNNIVASISCGINGTSTRTFTTSTLIAGDFLFANVTSTTGTPTLTTVNIFYRK